MNVWKRFRAKNRKMTDDMHTGSSRKWAPFVLESRRDISFLICV